MIVFVQSTYRADSKLLTLMCPKVDYQVPLLAGGHPWVAMHRVILLADIGHIQME